MFERRLKIFLGILGALTVVLVARAAQVQVVQRDQWRTAAAETMKRSKLVETVRGNIYDNRGRLLATDQPCIDACVDYRAITDPPDEAWIGLKVAERLKDREAYKKAPRARRREMVREETEVVHEEIRRMWARLAGLAAPAGQAAAVSADKMDETRREIVRRVDMRRRVIWYHNYKHALQKNERAGQGPGQEQSDEKESFWQRWLVDDVKDAPDLNNFSVVVAEQTEPHVILHAIDVETQNELDKQLESSPGLSLRPSTHRFYPQRNAFCHAMGRLTHVTHDDLLADPEPKDEARQYLPNDLIGRGGIEGMCERALRGSKGRVIKVLGEDAIVGSTDPIRGRDVRLTIDVELQARIESLFTNATLLGNGPDEKETGATLHGACVVIDVPTGEVRALASYPTYDLNEFDERYAELFNDPINQTLLNRATMSQLQPGSTVKPMVGLGAITDGLITPEDGIECTGYLVIDGKQKRVGRCWVASKFFEKLGGAVAHHPVPYDAKHKTGFLTFGDALERSCNVYFETLADRLKMDGLSVWFDRFGLGRPTGIGIAEARGRLPRDHRGGPAMDTRYKTWFSGIGQDPVAATPIQMANAAATIARDGVWMRPRLLADADAADLGVTAPQPKASTTPGGSDNRPGIADRVDLNLSKPALAAAKDGMFRVVNGAAGTGTLLLKNAPSLKDHNVCGKTGTAQAPKFGIPLTDEHGKLVVDERGRQRYTFLDPSTPGHVNPAAPWYRGGGAEGHDLAHAWYIGFAPADHPQIAFAVMVEYGGSGGYAAGAVASHALEACIERGYLK